MENGMVAELEGLRIERFENGVIACSDFPTISPLHCPWQAGCSTTEEDKFFSRILELTKHAASSRQGSDVRSKKKLAVINNIV